MSWDENCSTNIRKSIIERFLERLSKGYDNEPYLDDEIAQLIQEQCKTFSDSRWVEKMNMLIARNRI